MEIEVSPLFAAQMEGYAPTDKGTEAIIGMQEYSTNIEMSAEDIFDISMDISSSTKLVMGKNCKIDRKLKKNPQFGIDAKKVKKINKLIKEIEDDLVKLRRFSGVLSDIADKKAGSGSDFS